MPNSQPSTLVLCAGKFDTANGTSQPTLDAMFQEIVEAQQNSLVLHFHGGLIDRPSGVSAAGVLDPIYRQAGAYPVFFIWESGWKEVLHQNLPAIFQEGIFKKIESYLTRFAKGKIDKAQQTGTAKAPGGLVLPKQSVVDQELQQPVNGVLPFANVDPHVLSPEDGLTTEEKQQLQKRMQEDPQLKAMLQEISNSMVPETPEAGAAKGATVITSTKTLMSPDAFLVEEAPGKGQKKGIISAALLAARCAMALEKIVARFAKRRDHGFHLTVVEEILRAFYVGNAGKFLWDGMKTEIEEAFGFAADCGGTQFLTALHGLWKTGWRKPIFLVGHSAGAIYVSRFLQEVQNRKLPPELTFEVVLIAPACNFTTLSDTLKIAGNRITSLRVFGMGDEQERHDEIMPVVYPSSLLFLVSGVLEDSSDKPLAGMERFYEGRYVQGEFPDIDFVRKEPIFQKNYPLVWSPANNGPGRNCDMKSHGGWVAAPETVKSVIHILENGYGTSDGAVA